MIYQFIQMKNFSSTQLQWSSVFAQLFTGAIRQKKLQLFLFGFWRCFFIDFTNACTPVHRCQLQIFEIHLNDRTYTNPEWFDNQCHHWLITLASFLCLVVVSEAHPHLLICLCFFFLFVKVFLSQSESLTEIWMDFDLTAVI